jgi:hypothetical protein
LLLHHTPGAAAAALQDPGRHPVDGLLVCLTSAGADPVIFENTFSSTNVISGDTLTVTDTVTPSG